MNDSKVSTESDVLQSLVREIEQIQFGNEPRTVSQVVTPGQIRNHLQQYDFAGPVELKALFADVTRMLREWNVQMTHRRYLGLFSPAPKLASVVADALVGLYNPQLATWSLAPAANEMEQHVLRHIARKLGLPPGSTSAHFTTGGSEANLTAVLTALSHAFPEYTELGLMHLKKQPVLYVSEFAHNSFDKISKNVGLGTRALRVVPTDDQLRLDTGALRRMIEQDCRDGYAPFMLVGTAGNTCAGVIDPLEELAEISRTHHLWFHVDAAWAGAVVFSDQWRHLLSGIAQADSVTIDAHKWFSVSFGAGMFFCRHPQVLLHAFKVQAGYMPGSCLDTADPYHTTVQWTRRFTGLKLFMTLAESGEAGFCRQLEEQIELGAYFRQQLRRHGWKVVNQTHLPVLCFTHPTIEQGPGTVDDILKGVYAEGKLWISAVALKGNQRVFRACLPHYKTSRTDIDFVVAELSRHLPAW
jgi:glutamate/tyrosine decarboxylase-like PLP-dependent enzyme